MSDARYTSSRVPSTAASESSSPATLLTWGKLSSRRPMTADRIHAVEAPEWTGSPSSHTLFRHSTMKYKEPPLRFENATSLSGRPGQGRRTWQYSSRGGRAVGALTDELRIRPCARGRHGRRGQQEQAH